MAAFRITLLAIMIGAGANSAAGFRTYGFAPPPIINYGPSLKGWPSSNPAADLPFLNAFVIPTQKIPTADEIIKNMAKPGVNYEGFTFTSNGGGTTIISNKNGEIKTFKVGGDPPNADTTLNPDEFEPTIVENEDGTGFTSSHSGGFTSFTSTSSVNGKGVTVGGVTTSVNNNGKTEQQTTYFDSRDK